MTRLARAMSTLRFNLTPAVTRTAAPPIPKAKAWGATYAASPLAATAPLLDLSQGVPGTAPHASVLDALARASATHEAAKYGPILGEPDMRAALATELQVLYGVEEEQLRAEDVGITTGCNMAFLVLLMVLCPPGESSLLLPLPSYFNHAMSLSLQAVKPSYIPCDPSNGFVPSLSAARAMLAAGPQRGPDGRQVHHRGIVLTTPNNPTGAIYDDAALEEWYDLAREFNVPLVLDETYRDFAGGVPHRLFERPEWRETLVSLGSFSKGYRIPGHRLGSITAAPELLQHIATICDCMQICPPRPPQLALAPLLPSLRSDLAQSADALAARRKLFTSVAEAAGWRVLSSGGFYAYVEFPEAYTRAQSALGLAPDAKVGSEDVGRALALKCGVLTLPGCFFMPPLDGPEWKEIEAEQMRSDRWIRFAVANVSDETVRALGARLEQLNKIMGM